MQRENQQWGYAYLFGEINPASVLTTTRDIDKLYCDDNIDFISLKIHSGGGSVYDALGVYDLIRTGPTPVTCVVQGLCMSAATLILQAGTQRLAFPNAQFMMHPSKTGFNMAPNNENLLRADHFSQVDNLIVKILADRVGISVAKLLKLWDPVLYLNAEEAKSFGKNGLIDDIIKPVIRK